MLIHADWILARLGCQIQADCLHEKYTVLVPVRYYANASKIFMKVWKSGLFVCFGRFPCSWIRICIPITDPDTDTREPYQCGSGSRTLLRTVPVVTLTYRYFCVKCEVLSLAVKITAIYIRWGILGEGLNVYRYVAQ